MIKKALVVSFLFLIFAKATHASEGTFELKNLVGEPTRCFAASILMQDLQYSILVSCRDLIYPASGRDVFNYILWATPLEGGNPVNLGPLGLGKTQARMATAFTSLFVTKEARPGGQPAGTIVMRGELQPIRFLEIAQRITPIPSKTPESFGEIIEGNLTPTLTPAAIQRTTLGKALKTAILPIIGLTVIISILIFIVARKR